MRDVSVLASVSIKTVSRVINNDPAVAAATARRVRAAIDELAFRPDPVARSLRVGHDDAVALVVENIADPFMAEVTCAVEEVARERGKPPDPFRVLTPQEAAAGAPQPVAMRPVGQLKMKSGSKPWPAIA